MMVMMKIRLIFASLKFFQSLSQKQFIGVHFLELTGYPKRWHLRQKKLEKKVSRVVRGELCQEREASFRQEEGINTLKTAKLSKEGQHSKKIVLPVFLFLKCDSDLQYECVSVCVCACMCQSLQLCLIFCNPMDCRLSGSFIHGILQERILEWVAISFTSI